LETSSFDLCSGDARCRSWKQWNEGKATMEVSFPNRDTGARNCPLVIKTKAWKSGRQVWASEDTQCSRHSTALVSFFFFFSSFHNIRIPWTPPRSWDVQFVNIADHYSMTLESQKGIRVGGASENIQKLAKKKITDNNRCLINMGGSRKASSRLGPTRRRAIEKWGNYESGT
jgi:hypothetical protein